MKIMGTKYCGHDSALCLLDTNEKSIFAMSTERVTRIKHDQLDITPILEKFKFSRIDYVAHSYSDFEDKAQDGELREKMIYNKDIEKALRIIIKPSYIQDLNISRIKKNMAIFRALFTDFSAVKSYYSAKFKRSLVNETPEGNKKAFVEYIKINFKKFGLRPKKVLFYEHHLCHAIPSYYLSPFNGEKVIAMTIDGQGDGFFSKIYFLSKRNDTNIL